eukprot:UN06090
MKNVAIGLIFVVCLILTTTATKSSFCATNKIIILPLLITFLVITKTLMVYHINKHSSFTKKNLYDNC